MRNSDKKYTDIATLHINSIKTGFLPSLGVRFLALLYRCIDEADFAVLIVKYKDDELIGFVSGTVGTSSLYQAILYHPLELLLALGPVIFNCEKLKKILNVIKHMSGEKRGTYPSAELLTICVHHAYRRLGVADDLYRGLSDFFESVSLKEFVIIVGQSLDANKFYEKQGAKVVGKLQVHEGENSNVFIQWV